MIQVFHAVINQERDGDRDVAFRICFRPPLEEVQKWINEGKLSYKKVAEVAVDDMWAGFQKTNHIDSNWMDGPLVTLFNGNDHRSTSAGDVLVDAQGVAHLLQGVGDSVIPNWAEWSKE